MTNHVPIDMPLSFPAPGDVAGKRVMITGAGRGLGSLLAMAFSRAEARVALVARTAGDLEDLAAMVPGEALICPGDVSQEGDNDRICDQIAAAWGGLDVAVLNAGISPSVDDPLEMGAVAWVRIMDVNVNGVFFGARASARLMGAGGRIIATAPCSAAGRAVGWPHIAHPRQRCWAWFERSPSTWPRAVSR